MALTDKRKRRAAQWRNSARQRLAGESRNCAQAVTDAAESVRAAEHALIAAVAQACPPLARARACAGALTWIAALGAVLTVWAVVRWLFFLGLTGSDDLHHLRFALAWDRAPVNHWEARLLTNALLWLSVRVLGFSELAVALPSALGSLGVLASVVAWCGRHYGVRTALLGGMLVALLPIDVGLATTVSATPIMSAFVSVGTVLLLWDPATRTRQRAGALCLALGVVTHLSALYYVAALCVAALSLDGRRYFRPVLSTVGAGVIVLGAELLVFWLAYRDPLLPYRVAVEQASSPMPLGPLTADGHFNLSFVLWPLQQAICSQAFGVALLVAVLRGARRWHKLDAAHRVLLLSAALFWVWISFGTQVPWAYRPFHRLTRFWHPLTLAIAVFFAAGVQSVPARWARPLRVGVLAAGVVILACAGPWGQNVRISQELLAYACAHPAMQFVTDRKTAYDIHVLSALHPPPNVTQRAEGPASPSAHALLVNPLNLRRDAHFAEMAARLAGPLVHETEPAYRDICRVLPVLRRWSWALRKPPARVFLVHADPEQRSPPGGELDAQVEPAP